MRIGVPVSCMPHFAVPKLLPLAIEWVLGNTPKLPIWRGTGEGLGSGGSGFAVSSPSPWSPAPSRFLIGGDPQDLALAGHSERAAVGNWYPLSSGAASTVPN